MRRWAGIVLGAWGLVALLHLFAVRLANLWVLGALIVGVAWAFAVVVSLVAPFRVRRAGVAALALPAAGLLAAAGIVVTPWVSVYAHTAYALNRGAFADVADRADRGDFAGAPYYGSPLPARMRLVGKGTAVSLTDGTAVLLPVWTGIPDGGAGFGYVPDGPSGDYDCFGDLCRAQLSLGDGWYWLGS